MRCSWPMHNVPRYLYTYHKIQNHEIYKWNLFEELISITLNATIIHAMYIMINWVNSLEPRSSGGNKTSNPEVLALLPRLHVMRWRGCASTMEVIKLPPLVLVQIPLRNQFIHYYICSRASSGIIHFKLRTLFIVAIECLFLLQW